MGTVSTDQTLLDAEQRAFYERGGFLQLEAFVDSAWVTELVAASNEFIEQSRSLSASNRRFDLEAGHTPDHPRLRRLVSPVDVHDTFRRFAFEGPAARAGL